MNIITIFFLIMALLGLVDKFLGNFLGLAESFNKGMQLMPDFLIYLVSIYCLGPVIVYSNQDAIINITSNWFFDPSIISGSLLATDMGAYPISKALAFDEQIGLYSGICLGGSIGTLISFCLPVYISSASKEDGELLTKGFIYGICVLPITLIASGLMMGIPFTNLLRNLVPVLIVCLLVLIGLLTNPHITERALLVLGILVKLFAFISFAIIIFGLFFPERALVDQNNANSCIAMVAKMCINISGALITMDIIGRIFKKQLAHLGEKLGINEYSVMGFIVGMPAGVAMLPMLSDMDKKGKVLNGAFSVSCHYMFGGQMALIASNEPFSILLIFFFVKLVGGILAVLLANILENKKAV